MLVDMNGAVFGFGLVVVSVTYMSLWYGIARYVRRYDVVDSAWGLGFVLVAWIGLSLRANFHPLQLVSAALVSLWGLRLFVHIARRNWRRPEDDRRYQLLRQKWGSAAKRKAYTHIFLLQAVLLLVVSLPMLAIAWTRSPQLNAGTWIGWAIWLFGISFEAVADWQLSHFLRNRAAGSHQLMGQGLWRYSRHPNYFGEITTWWGAALVAISSGEWWGVLGALVLTVLITKISGIPPLEKHYDGNPAYEAYRRHTSALVPRPPKT